MNYKSISSIKERSLLGLIPGLAQLATEKATVKLFDAGEEVIACGQHVNALYIPISDNLTLYKENGEPLGVLLKGRSLALGELLSGEKTIYSAKAVNAVSVLVLPSIPFLALLDSIPGARTYLELVNSYAAARTLRTYLREHYISNEEVINIVGQFKSVQTLKSGSKISLGSPRLFLVASGELVVTDSESKRTAVLGQGVWFGGQGIVKPHLYSYSVEASTDVTIVSCDLDAFLAQVSHEGVVELIHKDPWITSALEDAVSATDSNRIRSFVPGEILSNAQIQSFDQEVQWDDLQTAENDHSANIANVINLTKLIGIKINEGNLRFDLSQHQMLSPIRIAAALEVFGLLTSNIETTYEKLPQQNLPILVQIGGRVHILLAVRPAAVLIFDACRGPVAMSRAQFEDLWDNTVFEAMKADTEDLTEVAEDMQSDTDRSKSDIETLIKLRRPLFRILRRYRKLVTSAIFLSVFSLGLGMLAPKIVQFTMNDVVQRGDFDLLWVVAIGTALMTVVTLGQSIINAIIMFQIGSKFDLLLSQLFYRHLHQIDAYRSKLKGVGDVAVALSSLTELKSFLLGAPVSIIFAFVQIIAYTIILLTYDVKLAGLCFLLFPITLGLRMAFKKPMRNQQLKEQELMARSGTLIAEQITGINSIKANRAEKAMRDRYEKVAVENAELARAQIHLGMISSTTMSLAGQIIRMGILWVGALLILKREITLGEVIAVNMYASSLMAPLSQLANMFESIEAAKVDADKVVGFFGQRKQQSTKDSMTKYSMSFTGKIKLERVSFRYEEAAKDAIEDINLTIYPGQVVALVGRSGCGKSTLANILAGYLSPSSGRVYYDNVDKELITQMAVRSQIGVVMQDNGLFAGSIAENICFSEDVPDDTKMANTAVNANVYDFVSRMPQGFNTYLAEGGLGLSGGQQQRMAIARTLYQDRKILILDEATSALDGESEAAILNEMDRTFKGRTVILIAHRFSTIKRADKIFVMDEGRVVEEGTHSSLIAAQGQYSELFSGQLSAG